MTPPYNADHIRQHLRSLREAHGYSQSTLATLMGLKTYEQLANLESGRGGKMLDRLANWAGSMGYVLTAVRPDVLHLCAKVDRLDDKQLAAMVQLLDSMTT